MRSNIIKFYYCLERESGEDIDLEVEVEVINDKSDFSNWGDSWPGEAYSLKILSAYCGEKRIRLTEEEKDDILAEAEEIYEKY